METGVRSAFGCDCFETSVPLEGTTKNNVNNSEHNIVNRKTMLNSNFSESLSSLQHQMNTA